MAFQMYICKALTLSHCALDENDRPSEKDCLTFKLPSVYVPVYISELTRT